MSELSTVEAAGAGRGAASRFPVSIVIPVFGASDKLSDCLESLVRHAPAGCEIVVADDATPDESVATVVAGFQTKLPIVYVRRTANLGFVENCNAAIREVLHSGNDVLLLNSDTQVTAGFLEEMWAVLHLHEKHGVVSPRSNNATIFSVPLAGRLPPGEAYQLWLSIRSLLPRYQVMPTAVGFCLLIKNAVLHQLGEFDPIYSPGYNEENDFICRINRHGYSAVAAHHAFVFHHESSSFGPRQRSLEQRNRKHLDDRYPEYARKVVEHMRYNVDPIDHFAMLWRPHRQSILFDLYHLPAKHSGTSDFALNLLLRLGPLLEPDFDIRLGLSEEAAQFFASELTGYRLFDERLHPDARFDLVFKPAQIFRWTEFQRMVMLGGRLAFTHLDIIAARCHYLSGPGTKALFRTAALLSDRVMTLSEFSKRDFEAYYGVTLPFEVIHLGTNENSDATSSQAGSILIIGNDMHHKAVGIAAKAVEGLATIVALGNVHLKAANTRALPSGSLSRAAVASLYDGAAVVVYPSFYEGFGMPILDAIARRIPVVALDTEVNRELRSIAGDGALFLVRNHDEMRSVVSRILSDRVVVPPGPVRSWADVAADYARSLRELLGRGLDTDLIRRRWDLLTTIDAVHPLET